MTRNRKLAAKLTVAVVCALFVGLYLIPRGTIMHAQDRRQQHIGMPSDWSHRHMIYSTAQSPIQALSLEREPRYLQQWYRRHGNRDRDHRGGRGNPGQQEVNETVIHQDWSELLGTNTAVATVGEDDFPAKYSFDINTANCDTAVQPDYVVYNTSVAPQASQSTATGTVTFNADATGGDTTTIGASIYTWHGTVGACGATADCVVHSGNTTQDAANLKAAVNDVAGQCGSTQPCFANVAAANASVTASSALAVTTLTSRTIGATGNFALTTNDPGQAVAFLTTGANVQASIVAYDNLYSGCLGTVPHIYWAYNTSGIVSTSPIISGDGSQIAFIHTPASGAASLVILKWKASEGATYNSVAVAPAAPGNSTTTAATYVSCKGGATSCQLSLAFANAANDSNSSPFYDYINDVLYVGDSTGHIHLFSGVFKGTPAEVGNPWITLTNAGGTDVTTSPVYDSVSGRVFIGDHAGALYNIACTSGVNPVSCSQSGATTTQHASAVISTGGNGIFDSPIVDGTAGQVYAFASHNTGVGVANRSTVFQFPVNFASAAVAADSATLSSTSTEPTSLFAGDFDNAYYSSDLGSTGANQPSGNMYVCGVVAGIPTLYQVPIVTNNVGAAVAMQALASAAMPCGPVTEALSQNSAGGTEDWLFMDVEGNSTQNGAYGCASGGCVMNVAIAQWQPGTTYAVGQHVLDSNHNIEVVTTAGASKTGAHPTWAALGATTADGTVGWLDQGTGTYGAWRASASFTAGSVILDQKGFIQEVTSITHTSGTTIPTWGTEATGTTTTDGATGLSWTNRGPAGISTIAAVGGSSGFIIDNFVPTGTLAGASQIYFTPLGSGTCLTSTGTGGCAVQASQATLH